MKKLLFFAFLSLTICFITGNQVSAQNKQPYQPMALEGAHWWVIYYDDNNPPWIPNESWQYAIKGDSILNEMTYKKVYFRELSDESPQFIEYERFSGLMRDDTLNRKVFLLNYSLENLWTCPVNEEFLLYDFNVTLGDTIDNCLVQDFGQIVIESVEYEYWYGNTRKILNYTFAGIEGIGSEYGVFEYGQGSKEKTSQTRTFGFRLTDYCLGTDQECGCQWVGIEEREKPVKLKVSPNPANEIVNFEFGNIQNFQQAQLRCYDVFGNLLHSEAVVQGQKEVVLDISSWPSGMYVAVVYSNGGVVERSKFVVE
jgi:hypothetical protein